MKENESSKWQGFCWTILLFFCGLEVKWKPVDAKWVDCWGGYLKKMKFEN